MPDRLCRNICLISQGGTAMNKQPDKQITMHISKKNILLLASHLILICVMILLLMGSAGYLRDGPTLHSIAYVDTVLARVGDNAPQKVRLPCDFRDLAPRTPVTLTATITPNIDDGIFIETQYTPAKVYLDGKLVFEFGKSQNYPVFMIDPATEIHIIETYGDGSPMDLKVEFFSPKSADSFHVEPFIVGTSKQGILERTQSYGYPWIFSLMQLICGVALLLISVCILIIDKKAALFLWLGLFSLMTGFWGLGSNGFSVTVSRSSALLYMFTFVGRFTLIIPLLHFMRGLIDFKAAKLLYYTEIFFAFSAGCALILQLIGLAPCNQTFPFFDVTVPAALVMLTFLMGCEYFRYKNKAAGWFLLPVGGLTLSAYLDVFHYEGFITRFFSPVFQLGSIIFLLFMGVAAGIHVKDSIGLRNRQKELDFEKELMEIQLKDQKKRSLLLAQHEQQLRQQRHDLRHQLVAIQEMAMEDNEKLQGYLIALLDNIPTPTRMYCENAAVNAVVAHYAGLCDRHGIELSVNLTVPADARHVTDGSLCAIFGNLLENATEACGRMEKGRKFIRLNSFLQYDMLTITMDNSFDGHINIENNRYRSSKRNDYGVGLTSIQSIARNTGGDATFRTDGFVFLSSVLLNL